jgi:L-ribulose-5-phosphate 4-epimerase
MLEELKRQIIKTGIMMDRYHLISISGGNVSVRVDDKILVTPSGMMYEIMVEDDIVVMDIEGKVIEGTRRVSVDTQALLYIFKHRPDINAIIHTHQPYATAVGLVEDYLPCCLTTLANATRGNVLVTKYASAASIDMGIQTVEYLGDKLAIILKNHGVIAVGKDLSQALYACVYLEEAAKTYTIARSMSPHVAQLSDEQIADAVAVFNNYGQKK